MHKYDETNGVLGFLYLNIYSFLIVCAGILVLVTPFYMISKWLIIAQGIIAIRLFMVAGKMFFAWSDKKEKIKILVKRNHGKFRSDTFSVFMQAPCGRLIVRYVLRRLDKQEEYKELLKLQKPLLERLRNNCAPVKTVIYINKEDV
jgi:hypothetical protein